MKCCRFLLHQILFSWGAIHPCCSYTVHSTKSQTVFEYFGELFDISSYIQNRQKYIESLQASDGKAGFRIAKTIVADYFGEHT